MNQYANDFVDTVRIYYDDLKKYKPLTKSKERRLLKLSKKGNLKAKNEILESNLKFVFDIAKRYTGRGVPISDLISEGNMGLLRAIEKFDISNDVKFISYAVWWIRQAMMEAIKKKKQLETIELNNQVSNDEIFDKKLTDDEDEYVEKDSLTLSNEAEEHKKELNKSHKELISKLLTSLNERERDIVEYYYGLGTKEELTLSEIGSKYGISSERVRQIKICALRKLRSRMMMETEFEQIFS